MMIEPLFSITLAVVLIGVYPQNQQKEQQTGRTNNYKTQSNKSSYQVKSDVNQHNIIIQPIPEMKLHPKIENSSTSRSKQAKVPKSTVSHSASNSESFNSTSITRMRESTNAGPSDFPNLGLKGIVGYAKAGNTTGGMNGPIVYITSLDQLRDNLLGEEPRILVIKKNIHSQKQIFLNMGSNKSIIGSWRENVINNVYLYAKGSNIIIQNILFLHSDANKENRDIQVALGSGTRFWIDHCTFDGRKVMNDDDGKLLTIYAKVDHVSITNSRFINHRYGLLFGWPSDNPTDCKLYNNYPRVTIADNYFENITSRAPGLMRFGKFHVYNNYVTRCRNDFTIAYASKIYSEYNYFDKVHDVLDDKGDGAFIDKGSHDMAKMQVSHIEEKWHPSQDYQYTTMTVDQTKSFCTKYSGAQQREMVFGSLM